MRRSSRNGRTNVRAYEDLSLIAGGLFGGLVGGLGMGGGMAVMGSMLAHGGGPLAVGSLLTVLASAYGAARFFFRRTSHKREAELQRVVERVVLSARQHAVKKLPR